MICNGRAGRSGAFHLQSPKIIASHANSVDLLTIYVNIIDMTVKMTWQPPRSL